MKWSILEKNYIRVTSVNVGLFRPQTYRSTSREMQQGTTVSPEQDPLAIFASYHSQRNLI